MTVIEIRYVDEFGVTRFGRAKARFGIHNLEVMSGLSVRELRDQLAGWGIPFGRPVMVSSPQWPRSVRVSENYIVLHNDVVEFL